MQGNGSLRLQRGTVAGCAVALVAIESVGRKPAAEPPHQTVASHLGADRSGGHGQAGGVGADDGRLTVGEAAGGVQRKGVHDHMVRVQAQAAKRAVHGQASGGGDSGVVDLAGRGVCHADSGGAGANQAGQPFAGARREALGVGHAGQQLRVQVCNRRQDDRGGGQWAGPGTPAGFIHAGDSAASLPQQPEFPARRWEPEREGADGAGLWRRLGAPLLDARRAANAVTQVVQLGAADFAVADHLNVIHDRRVQQKGPLHADPAGYAADREVLVDPAGAASDHGALEQLHAFTLALAHFHMHPHGVADVELGNLGLQVGLFDFIDQACHGCCAEGVRQRARRTEDRVRGRQPTSRRFRR